MAEGPSLYYLAQLFSTQQCAGPAVLNPTMLWPGSAQWQRTPQTGIRGTKWIVNSTLSYEMLYFHAVFFYTIFFHTIMKDIRGRDNVMILFTYVKEFHLK